MRQAGLCALTIGTINNGRKSVVRQAGSGQSTPETPEAENGRADALCPAQIPTGLRGAIDLIIPRRPQACRKERASLVQLKIGVASVYLVLRQAA
jgi:hypothetical protein